MISLRQASRAGLSATCSSSARRNAILYPIVNVLTFVGISIYDRLIGEKRRMKRAQKIAEDLTNEQIERVSAQIDNFWEETQAKIDAKSEEIFCLASVKKRSSFSTKKEQSYSLSLGTWTSIETLREDL